MSIKTNKSYAKRLKVTRRGKVLSRRGGQNHFNAKERRRGQMAAKRLVPFQINRKLLGSYLPTI
ncbi:MAG TPA: 50S ribosomal protein L35 [Candidatus Paceibacterota bacterium]